MGKEHDELMFACTDEVLVDLVLPFFGAKIFHSKYDPLLDVRVEDWTFRDVIDFVMDYTKGVGQIILFKGPNKMLDKTLLEIREEEKTKGNHEWMIEQEVGLWKIEDFSDIYFRYCGFPITIDRRYKNMTFLDFQQHFLNIKNKAIKLFSDSKCSPIHYHKKIEYPLMKGKGHYSNLVGVLDILFDTFPNQFGSFFLYENIRHEFLIEIKTEKDFEDVGAILRQINIYRAHYGESVVPYKSRSDCQVFKRHFCVLSWEIPSKIKEVFQSQDIVCFELGAKK